MMKLTSFHIALIGILLATIIQGSCSPRISDQSAQIANVNVGQADRPQSASDQQLLEAIAQFASDDERVSAPAWQILQSHGRAKLIADLTRLSDASAPDDRNRVLIAFTFCNLGHEYVSNRKILVSALSKQSPFKSLFGDWAVSLARRLMVQGYHELLALLFEVSDWSDGAMSLELAHAYSQALVSDPESFLRLLLSQSEATQSRVMELLNHNSFTADENTKVKSYLKNVSHRSKLRPIAEKMLRALTH